MLELTSLEFDTREMETQPAVILNEKKYAREYYYMGYSLLEDLDEVKTSKRKDNMYKFSVWKMKKWVVDNKR